LSSPCHAHSRGGSRRGFGLVLCDLPFERAPFTTTLIWPEVLDRDPGNAWLRQVAAEEAGKIGGIIPLP
jgi:hypothetical protein